MKTLRSRIVRAGLILALASLVLAPAALAAQTQFTTDFDIERCKFEPSGRQNPYFSLNPGDKSTFEGEDDGEEVRLEITVENETKAITLKGPGGATMSLLARVVVEREWVDGELVEESRNFFSRCRQTNDVFYFGESVDIFENGGVSHEGSWEAGVKGAQPGIIMPARFLLGSRYFQEQASGVAMDRAEHVEMELTVKAAGRTFRDCVKVVETSPLEPGHESVKVYCPGVGQVIDNEVTLTEFEQD